MLDNESIIRKAYEVAERQDGEGFAAMFAHDGYLLDVPAGQRYVGKDIAAMIGQFARAFPDIHRELGKFVVSGDTVVVELSLNGTHTGPLVLPSGTIAPTGKAIEVPCADVFVLEHGKIVSFHCYNAASVLLAQIGVLGNLSAALRPND